jgi:hypothetical protein
VVPRNPDAEQNSRSVFLDTWKGEKIDFFLGYVGVGRDDQDKLVQIPRLLRRHPLYQEGLKLNQTLF